jgi:adenylate cyclase
MADVTGPPAAPGGARRRRARRPPISLALVGLVVVLTAVTALSIGGLAWREQRVRSRAIVDAAMVQAGRLTAGHAARVLRDAEAAARLGPLLVRQGRLDPDDPAGLESYALAVLRAHPELSWVSYGDRGDRFVGVWQDAEGATYVNRSFPREGRIVLEEDRLLEDGRRTPARRSSDHGYRPRERPYFKAAEARRDVTWTEPYEFYAGGGLGITCAAPLLDARGGVRGVFTVDFSLAGLGESLQSLEVSPRGRVFIATRQGSLLVGQRRERGTPIGPGDGELVTAVTRRPDLEREAAFEFVHDGERYLGRTVPLDVGDLRWLVGVVVPETDFTRQVDASARQTLGLGLVAVALAVAAGIALAAWIARPLRELAQAARRIRQGDLEVTVTPRSRDELGVLARAMSDMVQALRDRNFVRETFGRYVSPEVAERALRDRGRLRLGGELREATILMSDLRGFSEVSERLGAEETIRLINRYLAHMTPIILRHGGTIDEFIGDAILVLFGVPFERPDDAERAVRCAWAMQQEMAAFNAESLRLGAPEIHMGIGLHTGVVVAGNIGSQDRLKYGVVGPPVNVAARVQALTGAGQIMLSDAVLDRVRDVAEARAVGLFHLKGIAAPVTLHELTAVREIPAPLAVPSRA